MGALPLPIASYQLSSPVGSSARLVNCFSSPAPQGGKSAVIITRSAGIATFANLDSSGAAGGRGAINMNGVLYALVHETLYRVDSAGAGTNVGTITGTGRVRMATNGTNFVIVRPSDNVGFWCNGSATTQITDAVFTGFGAADVEFIHGYYIFRRPSTGQFFQSQLNETSFTDFDAADIAEAEQVPDNLVALGVDHEEVLLFGTASAEVWYDAANDTGSSFSKSPGGLVSLGIAGSESHGKQDNSTFWLANDRTIRRLTGATPQKVSQWGIDTQLNKLTTISDCYTVPFIQEGHMMLAFVHTTDERTFVYDCTTQQWHERSSYVSASSSTRQRQWRVSHCVECYGKQIVLDTLSGKLGYLSTETLDEWGNPLRMSWTYQPVYAKNNLAIHRRFEIVCNVGHGLASGQGSDPKVTLEISDDGGETWRTMPERSLGLRGQYKANVFWDMLGSARQRVYRVTITDPIPVMVVDTQLTVEGAAW